MRTLLIAACAVALAAAGPAAAHHSYAMFDGAKTLTFKGRVKELQWTNPHVWLQVMIEQPDGKVVEWGFEGTNVASSRRLGWTKSLVKPGDAVTLVAHPARSGAPRAALRTVTLADGRALSAGVGVFLDGGPSFSLEGPR